MRSVLACLTVACLLAVGCEKTVSERETTTRHRDGTVTKSTATVKEAPDGTRTVERKTSVDR